jgi:hypothetical protein
MEQDGTPRDGARSEQIDGRYLSFESDGVGVAKAIPHRLGRTPVGFFEVAKTHAGGIIGFPNDQAVNRAWSASVVHLIPQTPKGTKHRVLLF